MPLRYYSHYRLVTFAAFLVVACSSLRAATVMITVETEDGKIVRDAAVTVRGDLRDKTNKAPVYGVTDSDGRVKLDIPEWGDYFICVNSLENELLDSCAWANPNAALQIGKDVKLAGVAALQKKVILRKGTTARIRVLDPDSQIATPKDADRPGFLEAGVWSAGHFYSASLVRYDKNSLEYEVVVPKGTDVHISFLATGVTLVDNNGRERKGDLDTFSFRTKNNESNEVHVFRAVSPQSKK